jgi:hypothetical protein
MPWQMAPGLIVVGTAFAVTGLGLVGIDNLFLGRVCLSLIILGVIVLESPC